MSSDQAVDAIELAVQKGYLTAAQASLLREEMFMFPGSNVVSIMMRRAMISPEQARVLEGGPEAKPPNDDSDMDFSFTPNPPATSVQRQTPEPHSIAPASQPLQAPQPPVSRHDRPMVSSVPPIARSAAGAAISGNTVSGSINPDHRIVSLFKAGKDRNCSDLHITVGKPPFLRQQGKLFFLSEPAVTAEAAKVLLYSVLTPEQQQELENNLQLDFSFEIPEIGRFRANVYKQRLGLEASYRFIPGEVPSIASLQLPKVLEKLTTYPQGLNLITGPSGCGKTSTVAAMLEFVNCHRHEHIITVEDPVEYVIHPKNCQVTQREVGTHTGSFASALRTALRQDPDVIMIGELRDLETTSIAITAAETGHLVFGTLHTSSAARTVARILDVYPPAQRAQICLMVAESLRGITSQQLIERKDGKGRVCAMEILLATTGVSQVIKEGKTYQLTSHMQSGRKLGMITMDDALLELVQSGAISGQAAYMRAENKAPFEMLRTQF